MKIVGLKKAVGDYQRANAEGYYSAYYGYLMYDTADGHIWTDVFYDLGHNSWTKYDSGSIVNLGRYMADLGVSVTMVNVKKIVDDPDFLTKYQSHMNIY